MSLTNYGSLAIKQLNAQQVKLESAFNSAPVNGDLWYDGNKFKFQQNGIETLLAAAAVAGTAPGEVVSYVDETSTIGLSKSHKVYKNVKLTPESISATSESNLESDIVYSYSINTHPVYVATTESGNVTNLYSSTNAADWSPFKYTTSQDMSLNSYGVDWDGNVFVAVGDGAANTLVVFTRHGQCLGLAKTLFTTKGLAVHYGNTLWVAGGEGTNSLASSPDGVTWIGQGVGTFSTRCNSVKYNGQRWVALGAGTNSIAYSDNGTSWTGVGVSVFTEGFDVCWTGMEWVAVGSGASDTIATSPDGVTWTGQGNTVFTTAGYGIDWNGEMWVAVGAGGNTIAFSKGTVITGLGNSLFFVKGSCVRWVGNKWIAGGDDTGGNTNSIVYSLNGESWRVAQTGLGNVTSFGYTNKGNHKVLFPRSRMIACGAGTPTLAISYDEGSSWTTIDDTIFATARGSHMSGNQCVAVGTGMPYSMAYSDDYGVSWNGLGNKVFTTAGYAVTKGGNVWVAVGEGTNSIAYSYDGYTWYGLGATLFTIRGRAVHYNGSRFVACGEGTTKIAYSNDGITWVASTDQMNTASYTLTYGKGVWLCGGVHATDRHILYSDNGDSWASLPTNAMSTSASVTGLTFDGEMFVAVTSGSAAVWYSQDGAEWSQTSTTLTTTSTVVWNGTRLVFGGVGAAGANIQTSFNANNSAVVSTGNIAPTSIAHISYNNSSTGVVQHEAMSCLATVTPNRFSAFLLKFEEKYKMSLVNSTFTDLSIKGIGTTGHCISWDGVRWYLGGQESYLWTSTDLITWTTASYLNTSVPSAGFPQLYDVKSNRVVTVIAVYGTAASNSILLAGSDGTVPALTTGHSFLNWGRTISYNTTRWIVGGNSAAGSGASYSMAYSAIGDGSTWTPVDNVIFTEVMDLLYVSGRWFACGIPAAGKMPIAVSDNDGTSWAELSNASISTVFTSGVNSMAWDGKRIVFASLGTNKIGYIDNYFTTTAAMVATAGVGVSVSEGVSVRYNGKYFLLCAGGEPYISYDGATFHVNRLPAASAAYTGGTLLNRFFSTQPHEYVPNNFPVYMKPNDTVTVHGNTVNDMKHNSKFTIYMDLEVSS
jgi:hypothetical protein